MADYKCEICWKGFYWPSLLTKHMRMHREPEFECNICQAKFKVSLNIFKTWIILRNFNCGANSCNLNLQRRLTMERHKTEKHLEEEDSEGHMKCSEDDCDLMFVSRLVKNTNEMIVFLVTS